MLQASQLSFYPSPWYVLWKSCLQPSVSFHYQKHHHQTVLTVKIKNKVTCDLLYNMESWKVLKGITIYMFFKLKSVCLTLSYMWEYFSGRISSSNMISSLLGLGQLLLPIIPCNLPSIRTSGGIGGSFSILLFTIERINFHMQTTHFGHRQCIMLLVLILFALFCSYDNAQKF